MTMLNKKKSITYPAIEKNMTNSAMKEIPMPVEVLEL